MTTKTTKDAQPEDVFIGTWRRQQMLEMDQRFCERVTQALAQERAEAAAGADRREIGGIHLQHSASMPDILSGP